jgi:hypothetical protein
MRFSSHKKYYVNLMRDYVALDTQHKNRYI